MLILKYDKELWPRLPAPSENLKKSDLIEVKAFGSLLNQLLWKELYCTFVYANKKQAQNNNTRSEIVEYYLAIFKVTVKLS